MRAKKALIDSIKYNLVAVAPTLVGVAIFFGGLYLFLGYPIIELLDILQANDLQWIMNNSQQTLNQLLNESMYLLGPVIMILGYMIHRVGRTFVLFYFQRSIAEDTEQS